MIFEKEQTKVVIDKLSIEYLEGAIIDFTEAIELRPDYYFAFTYRGSAKGLLQDYKEAIKDYCVIDIKDSDWAPKDFNLVTTGYLKKKGINPHDSDNWAKNDDISKLWTGLWNVNVTLEEIQNAFEEGFDAATDYVRVGVKSGGCSGLSYELKFDKELGENDKVFEDSNVKIAVEKKSFLYLAGTILEFSGGLNGKGFVFNNPNAQRTCGCGESFSL